MFLLSGGFQEVLVFRTIRETRVCSSRPLRERFEGWAVDLSQMLSETQRPRLFINKQTQGCWRCFYFFYVAYIYCICIHFWHKIVPGTTPNPRPAVVGRRGKWYDTVIAHMLAVRPIRCRSFRFPLSHTQQVVLVQALQVHWHSAGRI